MATELEVLETIRTIARTELEMERPIVPEDDLLAGPRARQPGADACSRWGWRIASG